MVCQELFFHLILFFFLNLKVLLGPLLFVKLRIGLTWDREGKNWLELCVWPQPQTSGQVCTVSDFILQLTNESVSRTIVSGNVKSEKTKDNCPANSISQSLGYILKIIMQG